jgi:hypothetical protein
MSKKSYDQRLRERWKRREEKEKFSRQGLGRFYDMSNMAGQLALILPFLFGKRNR